MIDLFFVVLASGINSAGGDSAGEVAVAPEAPAIAAPETNASPSQSIGQSVAAAPTTGQFNMAVVPVGLVGENQTPTGKFTTAAETKPILSATKGNWVAVREFRGKDLLYVTHIWSWRCGLAAMAISVNDEPMQNWPLPACHTDHATPNTLFEQDGQPYLTMRLGSVQKIDIQIVYDDLSMETASFQRGNVLIP